MTKQFIATICLLGIVGMVVGVAVQGAGEASIGATVTPEEVSVTVSPTSVPYGSMLLNETDDSVTITATAGTADVDLTIKGEDATYAEAGEENDLCADTGIQDDCTWTLSPAIGTAAYVHAYTTDLEEGTGIAIGSDYTTGWEDLTISAQNLSLDLVGNGTQTFKLDMRTPSTAGTETAYGKVYSTDVTIMAVYAY